MSMTFKAALGLAAAVLLTSVGPAALAQGDYHDGNGDRGDYHQDHGGQYGDHRFGGDYRSGGNRGDGGERDAPFGPRRHFDDRDHSRITFEFDGTDRDWGADIYGGGRHFTRIELRRLHQLHVVYLQAARSGHYAEAERAHEHAMAIRRDLRGY